MSDPIPSEIATMVLECHEAAVLSQRPTRTVAAEMVAALPDCDLLRRLATEFLVDAIARASRARTLEAERAAVAARTRQIEAESKTPEAKARQAKWQAERDAEEFRNAQMFYGVLGKALDRYTEDLHIKWTRDLLGSTFTLADGTPVTWGDATIEQHAERRQMFLNNAHANMEGAARHELALRELKESGCKTLGEMVKVAA